MPVADNDVLRDHVERGRRAVGAGLPAAVSRPFGIQQAVAPHQHGQLLLANQVAVQVIDGLCEELGGVLSFAARALVAGDQEDLVHADVKSVRLEGIDDLVQHRKDDLVHLRMLGTPTAAVDVGVVFRDLGCFIQFRILHQQWKSRLGPRLVPHTLELRNEADPVPAAVRGQFSGLRLAPGIFGGQLGVRLELETVVHLEDQHVHAHRRQGLGDPLFEEGQQVWRGRQNVDADPAAGRLLCRPARLLGNRGWGD